MTNYWLQIDWLHNLMTDYTTNDYKLTDYTTNDYKLIDYTT
jgi:hypothetical protein